MAERLERSTILLVDDNLQILNILADLLRPLGYHLLQATNGEQALSLARLHTPDLMLLDVMMPDMDGFSVCRLLRSDPQIAQMPVILITALDDRDSRVRGFEAGADDFVAKPFDYIELRARIATVLRFNRYRRLIEEQARVAVERARFAWVVEQSDDAYLLLDASDQIHYANPRARTFLGLSAGALPTEPFQQLIARAYHRHPTEAWAGWPSPANPADERFLVRPETKLAAEFWLRVDIFNPHPAGDPLRVVRLRDVTTQITSQRDMWTFHAMLTHKLRTPLVSIIGSLNLLNEPHTAKDPDAVARIAPIGLAGARRLQGEIEDILYYLRPPADLHGSDPSHLGKLPGIVNAISEALRLATVSIELPPELQHRRLALSRHSVEVIFQELLENAAKFHPTHAPNVRITITPLPNEWVAIAVSDDGSGLAPNQFTQVWRPYFQAEKSFTGQVAGMGLGLPLVARIVMSVGGQYQLRIPDEAPGLVVELTLPLAIDKFALPI